MQKFLPKVGLLTYAFCLLFSTSMLAQPPCLPVAGGIPPGDNAPGCTLCGPILTSTTSGYGPSAPGSDGFPCGTIENNQFISIVADETGTLDATILASDCLNNQGVQLIIYDQSFTPVSNCFSPPGINLPGNVQASGLTPGEIYWIMIDGFAGDICEILLSVSGGAATFPPDPPGPMTVSPDVSPLCPGAEVCYSIEEVNGASEYEWIIPGNAEIISGGGPDDLEVCVRYTSPGGGVVRVTPSNPCFPGIPGIKPVVVLPILPTLLPTLEICIEKFPLVVYGKFCETAGYHEIIYKTALGCDSIVSFVLVPLLNPPNQISATICEGDFFEVGDQRFDRAGVHKVILGAPDTTSVGCDSIVILSLNVLNPVAQIALPDSIGCNPGDSVILDGSTFATGANLSFLWTSQNGGTMNGPSNVNYTSASSPGTYILTVSETDSTGFVCISRDTIEVFQENQAINSPIFSQPNTSVCTGDSVDYSITPVTGADTYEWFLPPGATFIGANNSTSVQVDFTNATSGEICVIAHGVCGKSPRVCFPLNVSTTPNSNFEGTQKICLTDAGIFTYNGNASPFANYQWNFNGGTPANVTGAGPHNILWDSPGDKTVTLLVEEFGCKGTPVEHIIEVDPELTAPIISCTSTRNSITFSWNNVPNANEYSVSINGGTPILQSNTTFQINNLSPGEEVTIIVEANGTTLCPPSSSTSDCVAQNCENVNLNINPVADICRDPNSGLVNLSANPSGGIGGGTFTWSGPGTSVDGTFNPLDATVGINTIALEYSEGTCTYTETIEILINNIPDPTFTVTDLVCEGDIITVTYTGSAGPNAVFEWDFGQGQVVSGAGTGQVGVFCPPGSSAISLIVLDNGCTSRTETQIVVVEEPLAPPVIDCISSSSTEVVMGWSNVLGAANYTVNTSNGDVDYGAQTVTFTNLSPGDEVTIEVIADGNSVCPPSRSTHTCQAEDCPGIDIIIPPVGPFCDDGKNAFVMLSATAGDNSGDFTWSGPGVSQPNIFDPNAPGINTGTLTIRVSYQENNCTYSGSTDVEILEQPSADFDIESPICIDETASVNYTGGAATAIFNWDFQNGINSNSATGAGPYEIGWTSLGLQTISLTVEENGCVSEPVSQDVLVEDKLPTPIISCDSDQNSISFSWLAGAGVSQYTAEVTGGTVASPTGIFNGSLNYNFTDLEPGDEIEITVTGEGNTACGPVSATAQCVARDCPDYNLVMPVVKPICTYGNEPPFSLLDSMEITNQLGISLLDSVNLFWHDGSGGNTYVTAGGQFFTNAAVSSFGTGNVPIAVEIEYPKGSGCVQTHNSSIRLNPIPDNSLILLPQICVSETAELTLSNLVNDPDASFNWNFGNADNVRGDAEGPYELTWVNGGFSDTISVQITEFGCLSDLKVAVIQIDAELNVLDANLRCNTDNTTNSFIEFNWDDVPNATDYDVEVLTLSAPTPDLGSGFATFDNLNPRDEIEIQLTVSDANSACPPVSITKTCTAIACPPTTVEIDPIADNCLPTTGSAQIQLNARLQNDPTNLSGDLTFTGDMVSASGIFTPDSERNYTVAVTYSANGCSYNSTLDIEMWATPIADFEVPSIICVTDEALINFTGIAPTGAVFSWEFDGAQGANADARNPAAISWNDSDLGIQNLVLNIENHGCLAAPAEKQVQVDPELQPLNIQCTTPTTTSVGFTWDSDANATDYEVSIKIDAGTFTQQGIQTNTDFALINLTPGDQSLIRIEVTANGDTECGPITESKLCLIAPCPDIPVNIDPIPPVCVDANVQPLAYTGDFSMGGLGTGTYDFSGAGMNNFGLFNPSDAGVGTHTISVSYTEQSCTYENTLDVIVHDLPKADAGEDQEISCFDLEVEIGNTSPDPSLDYAWFFDGSFLESGQNIFVENGGEYTLEVTDPATGCKATDPVFVDASFSNPNVLAEVTQITCFGRNDGVITITGMENGTPPFEFSFNGSNFSDNRHFGNLGSGSYTIIGRDANGCEDDISFEIIEPDDLTVEIIIIDGENPVQFGDSIHLAAVTNYAPDLLASISWTPTESFPICDETNITNCLSHWVSPTGQTVYSVRVENLNGCAADDVISIIGEKKHPVFIPSGFSPHNGDGRNDFFGVFGDPNVVSNIRTFKVFDRWGEQVYENYNLPPTIESHEEAVIPPELGWDGKHRGRALNSGVFVYVAEVEFFDGTVEIFKGDVTIR